MSTEILLQNKSHSVTLALASKSGVRSVLLETDIKREALMSSGHLKKVIMKLLNFTDIVIAKHPKTDKVVYQDCKNVTDDMNEYLQDEAQNLFPFEVFRHGTLSVKESQPIPFFGLRNFSDHYINFILIADPSNVSKTIFMAVDATASYNIDVQKSPLHLFCITARTLDELRLKLKEFYKTKKTWEVEVDFR